VQGVDEVSKTSQSYAVVLAIQILQAGIDFEDVREGAGALHTEFLVLFELALVSWELRAHTLDVKDAQCVVTL